VITCALQPVIWSSCSGAIECAGCYKIVTESAYYISKDGAGYRMAYHEMAAKDNLSQVG
jgi:hypothetical protein